MRKKNRYAIMEIDSVSFFVSSGIIAIVMFFLGAVSLTALNIQYLSETIQRPAKYSTTFRAEEVISGVQNSLAGVPNLEWMFGGIVAILILIALAVVYNDIKLSVRVIGKNIEIMKYLGATDSFIIKPFCKQGALIGLVGSAIAAGALSIVYEVGTTKATEMLPFLKFLPSDPYMILTSLGLVVIGFLIGSLSSVIATKRYLYRE